MFPCPGVQKDYPEGEKDILVWQDWCYQLPLMLNSKQKLVKSSEKVKLAKFEGC